LTKPVAVNTGLALPRSLWYSQDARTDFDGKYVKRRGTAQQG